MFSWIAVSISASCFATRRARETAGLILSTIACKLGAGIFSFEQAALTGPIRSVQISLAAGAFWMAMS
jgi:hypothetical protein